MNWLRSTSVPTAIVEIVEAAVALQHLHVSRFRAGHGAVVAVETRHGADLAVGVGAHRNAQIQRDVVVQPLEIETEVAPLELLAEIDAELAAVVGMEARIADAVAER